MFYTLWLQTGTVPVMFELVFFGQFSTVTVAFFVAAFFFYNGAEGGNGDLLMFIVACSSR